GTLAIDREGRTVGIGDAKAQTRFILESIRAVLEAAGGSLADIAFNHIFLKDLKDYAAMNEIYREFFPANPPARYCIRADLATPDAAADAAAAMHTAMDSFPREGGIKLALGIGFHHGPVTQKDDDVYGDTVNLAASLVERAANAQIITTRETASHLSPLYRAWMRKLYSIDIKGRSGQVALCELVWRADDNATLFAKTRVEPRPV